MTPEELMDALEMLAKENGYGIKEITFSPRVQPANSSAEFTSTKNNLMTPNFRTGMQHMADSTTFKAALDTARST